jgi:TonB-linked SusC/RagA family outer membrane protein
MKNVHFLSYLKLRASYGVVGNDQGVGRFLYLPSTYTINGTGCGYNFGYDVPQNKPCAKQNAIGNPLVHWETAYKQDYGLDMKFLNDQLSMSFDYFHQYRTNILSTLNTVPDYVAAPLPAVNLGKVKNHGYEAKITWRQSLSHNFSYHVGANASFARNKIIYMDEIHQDEPYLYHTGHTVGQPFGYIFDRFYKKSDFNSNGTLKAKFAQPSYQSKPGDLKYKDLNGDGVINSDDERAIGYPAYPEYSLGATFGFHYRNFTVTTQWQGAALVSRNFSGAPYRTAFGPDGTGAEGTFLWQAKGAWTPEKAAAGQKITYPRLTTTAVSRRNTMDSDFWLKNSGYIRLKNAEIAYTLPAKWLASRGIKKLQVYMSGYDLLTFSRLNKYSVDPEQHTNATAGVPHYPITRVINFGIHMNF